MISRSDVGREAALRERALASLQFLHTSMPLSFTSVRQLASTVQAVTSRPTTCPRCSLRSILYDLRIRRQSQKGASRRVRNASTLVSSTAVNATKDIPPKYRELYDALQSLKRDARNFVDLSKVNLALRGLESSNATIRIAGSHSFTPLTHYHILTW